MKCFDPKHAMLLRMADFFTIPIKLQFVSGLSNDLPSTFCYKHILVLSFILIYE